MTNWLRQKINLVSIFKKYNTGRIDIQTAGRLTSEKLLKLKPSLSPFRTLAKKFDKIHTEKNYNGLLKILYDYADSYGIWIEH